MVFRGRTLWDLLYCGNWIKANYHHCPTKSLYFLFSTKNIFFLPWIRILCCLQLYEGLNYTEKIAKKINWTRPQCSDYEMQFFKSGLTDHNSLHWLVLNFLYAFFVQWSIISMVELIASTGHNPSYFRYFECSNSYTQWMLLSFSIETFLTNYDVTNKKQ